VFHSALQITQRVDKMFAEWRELIQMLSHKAIQNVITLRRQQH
jgi:hypothetical protein